MKSKFFAKWPLCIRSECYNESFRFDETAKAPIGCTLFINKLTSVIESKEMFIIMDYDKFNEAYGLIIDECVEKVLDKLPKVIDSIASAYDCLNKPSDFTHDCLNSIRAINELYLYLKSHSLGKVGEIYYRFRDSYFKKELEVIFELVDNLFCIIQEVK